MPVKRIRNKFKWGNKGKLYPTKAQALKQGRAIKASQARAKKK